MHWECAARISRALVDIHSLMCYNMTTILIADQEDSMVRLLRGLARIVIRLVPGTMLGRSGLILTGCAPVLAIAAALVLLARAVGR